MERREDHFPLADATGIRGLVAGNGARLSLFGCRYARS